MKISSAKAKGRGMCKELRDAILETFPDLEPDDIRVTASGVTGEDLHLSPAARRRVPFAIECKAQEKLNIWAAIKQAQAHAEGGPYAPLVAFRKNRETAFVSIPMGYFLDLLGIRWSAMQAVRKTSVIEKTLPSGPEIGQE